MTIGKLLSSNLLFFNLSCFVILGHLSILNLSLSGVKGLTQKSEWLVVVSE